MCRIALVVVFLLAGGILACGGATTRVPPSTPGLDEWIAFSDGSFRVSVPDWGEVEPSDDSTLKILSQGGWVISVGKFEIVPRLIGRHFVRIMPDHGSYAWITLDDRNPDRVTLEAMSSGSSPTKLRMHFLYCDGASYQLAGSAPEEQFSDFLPVLEQALGQASCSVRPVLAPNENGMVGMVLNPSEDGFDFLNYRMDIVQARQAGIEAAHVYINWANVEEIPGEYDWTIPDLIIDPLSLEGMRLSAVIEYIHTSVPGPGPQDLDGLSFDDPTYIERAASFASAVAERYGSQLDYLAIGNEVNIFFETHPNELAPYLEAFAAIRAAVASVRPELPTGTVLAFHEAVKNDRLDLVEAFKIGDFLAYTYYPHEEGFRYDVRTGEFGEVLLSMIDVSGETPFIIVENGFSSASSLGSDEARQAAYVQATFIALAESRQAFGRHIWFGYHDGLPEGCSDAALSFFPSDFDPASVPGEAWQAFTDYLCTLGFRRSDGSPKRAWDVLVEELTAYRTSP